MHTFRSEVFPDFFSEKLNYSHQFFFIGSCFTENIGAKLKAFKFPTIINPFGILYNPVSVKQSLEFIIDRKLFAQNDLEFYKDKWISFNHHGRFSSKDKEKALQMINNELSNASSYLEKASVLYITFGTSWVYQKKDSSKIVANCHKLPANEFEHFSLSVDQIVEDYKKFIRKINTFNPDLRIVFTVSPVRHWKDGPVNNQLSKSTLIVAIHKLVEQFEFISYFPSYEIMIDDLRDYRFYADDYFHPNEQGINYIWQKFRDCYLSEKAITLMTKIEKLNKSIAHRPFYPKTIEHKNFLNSNLKQIEQLKAQYPFLNFDYEQAYFNNKLKEL